MGINVYNDRFKICLPPYFPNRIEKISELRNFVKVGGAAPPNTPPSNVPVRAIISDKVNQSGLCSVMADTTPDVSHSDELSIAV